MKRSKYLMFLFLMFAGTALFAQSRPFGLGIMLGDPSGLNGKYFLNSKNAVEVGLGVGVFGSENSLALHVDYLYHNEELIQSSEKFPVFYGFGLRIRSKEEAEFGMGVRGIIGMSWVSQTVPIDVFIHIAPVFKLFPATKFGIDAALGTRYFF